MQTLNIFDSQRFEFNAFKPFNNTINDNSHRRVALMEQLQTTLELDKLLNIFAMEAAKIVDFAALHFTNKEQAISIRGGNKGKRERQFELKVHGELLGTLTYEINSPISLVNQRVIRELHQYLVYPVFHALQYQKAMKLARHDGLTSLGNRRYFDEQLKRAMNLANRQCQNIGLIMCDLNKFKIINDTFGHKVGDEILVHFSDTLKNSVRDSDSVFRFGGDEFAIIVEDACSQSLSAIDNRVKLSMEKDFLLRKYNVGCSFGAAFMEKSDTEHSFFERADQALYKQKQEKSKIVKLI